MDKIKTVKPLYQQAYEIIRRSIITGEISPGEKIIVNDLSKEYQISRTPLREALRQLQKEGLIEQNAFGSTVVELNQKDFNELCVCRLALEVQLIKQVVNDITDVQLEKIEKVLNTSMETVSKDETMDTLEHNNNFHDLIVECCSNTQLKQLLNQVRSRLLIYRANILKFSSGNNLIVDDHLKIFDALKERNVEKAVRSVEEHALNDQERGNQLFNKSPVKGGRR